VRAKFVSSIQEISAEHWNALWPSNYPFTLHGFLKALEESASVCGSAGWQPRHLLIFDDSDTEPQLLAAMPLYEKNNSTGEYVFDWAWADAYCRHGLEYYPKLLCAIPFTPATGPRVGFSSSALEADKVECLLVIMKALRERLKTSQGSGFHCLFPNAEQRLLFNDRRFDEFDFVERLGCQFHWFNQSFNSFDDFLQSFSSRKRKNVKRERRKVNEQGVIHQFRPAADISAQEWQEFYQLYRRTYAIHSGHVGYLNTKFFMLAAQNLPYNMLLATAHLRDTNSPMLAAALFFRDQNTLYGRYWGTRMDYDGLHFETCYYQGIDYAIEHGLNRFDPGAQGEHKIQRGFTPVLTSSFHFLQHPDFHQAIHHFAEQERGHVLAYAQDCRTSLPFREQWVSCSSDTLLNNTRMFR